MSQDEEHLDPGAELNRQASYGQILRSSSIVGGAQGLNYAVSLLRVKVVAVLLGPSGVGLIGIYQSLVRLLTMVASLGINSSGIREVASAQAREDRLAVARTTKILRRACWATGLAGWLLTALLSEQISRWVFGNTEHTLEVALLGSVLMLTSLSGGEMALIQGMRRIGDLARVNVTAMLINTVVTIGGYAWLGIAGIVPVLLASALVTLLVSRRYSRRIEVAQCELSLPETLSGARSLASLGIALMWSGLLALGVDLFARSIITREYGIEAAGLYEAAWALSGLFAGFVLGAMAADFYPRLTGAIDDRVEAVRLINEQIEIGILLALPGLLATLAFAPIVIRVIFSAEFIDAAAILPWFMLGVFGQVISWPCGFVQLAMGKGRWYLATQTVFLGLRFVLLMWLVPIYGVIGAAYAFTIVYFLYVPGIVLVVRHLVGFSWSADAKRLLALSALVIVLAVGVGLALSGWDSITIGAAITVFGTIVSLRGLDQRLGSGHRLIKLCRRVPGASWVIEAGRG